MKYPILLLAWLTFAALIVPVLWLSLQVVVAPRYRIRGEQKKTPRPSVAVLVPAHNEALGIASTIDSIKRQLSSDDRLIVIADNCTDDTAGRASSQGAEVTVRTDPERRGKGYALAFGIRYLSTSPPGVVVIIDADCLVSPGALDRLARSCFDNKGPVQAAYLMCADNNSRPQTKIAEFAWTVKNLLRPSGAHRLGLGCQLTGSGMALPWDLAHKAPLASSHIVEDLKLGLDLALKGAVPKFCAEAQVTSTFPKNTEGASIQRTRWEHGHLGLILSYGPRIAARGLLQRNFRLFMLAIDLCVPPISLLIILTTIAGTFGAIGYGFTGSLLPWGPLIVLPLLALGAVLVCWGKVGRKILSAKELRYIVLFAASKIPIYIAFVRKRQTEWISSTRDKP